MNQNNNTKWNSSAHQIWLFKLQLEPYSTPLLENGKSFLEIITGPKSQGEMRMAILQLRKKMVRSVGVRIVDPRFQVSHGKLISYCRSELKSAAFGTWTWIVSLHLYVTLEEKH